MSSDNKVEYVNSLAIDEDTRKCLILLIDHFTYYYQDN